MSGCERTRLLQDELLHLSSELCDFKPSQQDLLFSQQLRDNQPALFPRFLKKFCALGFVIQIGFFQQTNDVGHLVVNQLAEMVAHPFNFQKVGVRTEVIFS